MDIARAQSTRGVNKSVPADCIVLCVGANENCRLCEHSRQVTATCGKQRVAQESHMFHETSYCWQLCVFLYLERRHAPQYIRRACL